MYPHLPERILSRPERLALLPVFEHWAGANGIPVDLLMAIAWQESGWNNAALSSKGAVGIGQIMPDTGTWVARYLIGNPELDPNDPEDNIRISARFLDWLLANADDEEQAIAAYYQGLASVRRDAPYASTEQYVAAVQAQRRFFVTD